MSHPRLNAPSLTGIGSGEHRTLTPRRRAEDRTGVVTPIPGAVRCSRQLTALVGCSSPLMSVGVAEAAGRGGISCYNTVQDADQLVSLVGRQRPDLVLLVTPFCEDMPALTRRLLIASRSSRTVVLAADVDGDAEVLALLREGACGYLPLGTPSDRLVDALHAVVRGELAVPRARMVGVLEQIRGTALRSVAYGDVRLHALSPRELDVLAALADGADTGEVAARLGVGAATVRGYVASVVRRLGVCDRQAAVELYRADSSLT